MTEENRIFVFIIGMHRSGTSCLAGSLERCGLFLSNVRETRHFNANAKGHFELKVVERLHDQILGLNRASWHNPPQQLIVHPHLKQALKNIADELSLQRPCGLKDPRTVLLLDTWLKMVTPPYQLVGTFRHPLAVAQSLAKRDGIQEKEALKLWLHYNNELIQHHQITPFPIVEFDLSDVGYYCRTILAIAQQLGLSPNRSKLRRFVSHKLEHHRFVDAQVPQNCLEVYTYLRNHRFQATNKTASYYQLLLYWIKNVFGI